MAEREIVGYSSKLNRPDDAGYISSCCTQMVQVDKCWGDEGSSVPLDQYPRGGAHVAFAYISDEGGNTERVEAALKAGWVDVFTWPGAHYGMMGFDCEPYRMHFMVKVPAGASGQELLTFPHAEQMVREALKKAAAASDTPVAACTKRLAKRLVVRRRRTER